MRLLILLLIPVLALAAPRRTTPTPTPKVIVKQDMVCRTKQTDLELRDWINGLINEVHKAQSDVKQANDSNAQTKINLDKSNTDLENLKKEMAQGQQCTQHPFVYGFKKLMRHIFWILGAIVGLLILLVIINIFTGGALSGFFAIFGTIGQWINALIPKPKPPTPPPPIQPPKI